MICFKQDQSKTPNSKRLTCLLVIEFDLGVKRDVQSRGLPGAASGSRQTSWVIMGSRVSCNLQGNIGDLDGPRGSMEMFRGPRG